ncbi:hypothetical protein, partial [Riemerella anatipestifer]|uniref:hypothetical protein n=1 Tax=Riemerella anatipestifer TaxID=34085 RepID=UPI001C87B32E
MFQIIVYTHTHTHTHTHTQIVPCLRVLLYYFLYRFSSLIISPKFGLNRLLPTTFVGGFWRLSYSNFSFHKYMLKAPLFCLIIWSFLLGAFSVQGEYFALSVLAFPLVLCVFRGGRRFFRL